VSGLKNSICLSLSQSVQQDLEKYKSIKKNTYNLTCVNIVVWLLSFLFFSLLFSSLFSSPLFSSPLLSSPLLSSPLLS
jgi:hypothetical protein